jgi:hypothetical protein
LTLLKTVQQNGTIKPGPKQDRSWLPGTGGLAPRAGTGEVGTNGVKQHRRRLSGILYKERTSGWCGNSGGGWGKITSAAACGAGAAALGWGDTTAETGSWSNYPPGCYYSSGFLYFNTQNPNVDCSIHSSTNKCLCTLTCPPGTYQDQSGQASCKACTSGQYQNQTQNTREDSQNMTQSPPSYHPYPTPPPPLHTRRPR